MAKQAIAKAISRRARPATFVRSSGGSRVPPLNLSYLEGTIGYTIKRAQLAIFRDIYRAFGDISVTTAQFSILAVVADNPGVNQADLALALGVERPRIVPLLDSLETRGLAERISGATDRRERQIHLTKEGAKVLAELKERFAGHQQRLIDAIGPSEAHTLLRNLQRVASLLNPEDDPSRA